MLIRTLPIQIEKEEALLRRIIPTHEKSPKIQESLRKRWAGYRGEQNLDYHLTFLPEKDYFVFQGLNLKTQEHNFQIDALVASARLITIIESKNFQGKLTFVNHQMIRSDDNQEQGFPNPLAQVKRHQHLLKQWLDEHKLKPCPIEYLVSISNPSTIIKATPGVNHKVYHAEHIPFKIQELEKTYPQPSLSPHHLQKLCKQFMNEHQSQPFDVMDHYSIPPTDIIPGIYCPHCNQLSMSRIHSSWLCPWCSHQSRQAHKQAIKDYLLLYSTITNRQCKEFLQISSSHLATRLLQSMNLTTQGTFKSTLYKHRAP